MMDKYVVRYSATDPGYATPWDLVAKYKADGLAGVFMVQPVIDATITAFADACKAQALPMIYGLHVDIKNPDLAAIAEAKKLTSLIAAGFQGKLTESRIEWDETEGDVAPWLQLATDQGYTWVCCPIPAFILRDMKAGGKIRDALGKTLCMCMSGYQLLGYVFADKNIPYQDIDSLNGRNLNKEFGLTFEALKAYITPMNIVVGAGYQAGLNAGTRLYANQLGFQGVIAAGLPGAPAIDWAGTDLVAVKPVQQAYPPKHADFAAGYVG